jgi:NAD(P)-dependent dehydrogenase (short-subunit alcohol dehydrogenase family)
MTVLVTGGLGGIGQWVVRGLLARGESVTVLDNRADEQVSATFGAGGRSGSGTSLVSSTGNQNRRNNSPIGVPWPVRVKSSLSARDSTAHHIRSATDRAPATRHSLIGLATWPIADSQPSGRAARLKGPAG